MSIIYYIIVLMPEIPVVEEQEIKKIIGERELWAKPWREVPIWFKETDYEHIGSGHECAVFRKRSDPERVIAFRYEKFSPENARKTYYLHRVFSTLFPHNFPRFYMVASPNEESEDRISSVRQAISGVDLEEMKKKKGFDKLSYIEEPFEAVREFCQKLSLPVNFENNDFNFIITDDKKEYYIDTITDSSLARWPIEALIDYMDHAVTKDGRPVYSKRNKEVVEKSIRRIEAINRYRIT